jgi:hypothetical protein
MNTKTQTLDTLGKLLATENITIVRKPVRTASFDIKDRIITIPTITNNKLNEDSECLFVFHEVSLALITSEYYSEKIKEHKYKNLFGQYMNVVEDARVERLIKMKFPGVTRDFAKGYSFLYENGFFGDDLDVSDMSIVNRVNLYFKLGSILLIQFSEKEQKVVDQICAAYTEDDTYNAALALYELGKEEKREEEKEKNKQKQQQESGDDDSDDSESTPSDGDETEEDDTENGDKDSDGNKSPSEDDVIPDYCSTQETFDETLENVTEAANNKNSVDRILLGLSLDRLPVVKNNARVLADFYRIKEQFEFTGSYKSFIEKNNRIVDYMVREFEMKKSAERLVKNTSHKSGSINVSKVFAYKTSDDIFKIYNKVNDDKNHGMLILLDWSGSIRKFHSSYVKQLITLVSFCRRVGVKFEVYAFSSHVISNHVSDITVKQPETKFHTLVNGSSSMFEFFNSEMSQKDFNFMSESLYHIATSSKKEIGIFHSNGYGLNYTPLNSALVFANYYLYQFKKNRKLEKTSCILISDGGDSSKIIVKNKTINHLACHKNNSISVVNESTNKIVEVNKLFLTNAIVEAMSSGHADTKFFCFHYGIDSAYNSYGVFGYEDRANYEALAKRKDMVREFNTEGYVEISDKNIVPYDSLYVINSAEDEFDYMNSIGSDSSKMQIVKAFARTRKAEMNSRTICLKFVRDIC